MTKTGTIFAELLKLTPRYHFDKSVKQHGADYYSKSFTAWKQFITLLYAQITRKDSLRDIQTALTAQSSHLYHIGLDKAPPRSTFSDAMQKRDSEIFEDMFYKLLERCKDLTPKHKFRFKNPMYTIDSTLIDLCMASFPWAKYSKTKGALKLHYSYDHSGALPVFMTMTEGREHDSKTVKERFAPLPPDSILSIDRGYIDYNWLYSLTDSGVYFVMRTKKNFKYYVTGQHKKPSGKGVISDEKVMLGGVNCDDYPDDLRLVSFFDETSGKNYEFMTNIFHLSASTIAEIYKARWQIELFFKWIKQNLKIKTFLGTSKNAVMSQIWVAMCYYLLLSYIKYQTRYANSLLELSRVIRATIMERKSLIDILTVKPEKIVKVDTEDIQTGLF